MRVISVCLPALISLPLLGVLSSILLAQSLDCTETNGYANYCEGQFANGAFYQGEWADGRMDGMGYFVDPTEFEYSGDFKAGIPHGHGTYKSKAGYVYSGGFADGKFSGEGRYVEPGNLSYTGQFEDDEFHGFGTLIKEGGIKYVGYFRYGYFHGKGHVVWPDGTQFKGLFADGLAKGSGELTKHGKVVKNAYFDGIDLDKLVPSQQAKMPEVRTGSPPTKTKITSAVLDETPVYETNQTNNQNGEFDLPYNTARFSNKNFRFDFDYACARPTIISRREGVLYYGMKSVSTSPYTMSAEEAPGIVIFNIDNGKVTVTQRVTQLVDKLRVHTTIVDNYSRKITLDDTVFLQPCD